MVSRMFVLVFALVFSSAGAAEGLPGLLARLGTGLLLP